jgi:cytochrome c oxidase subunit IV
MSEVVLPIKTYVFVWALLLVLLAATVGVAYVHLGWLNPVVALSIALVKAAVIVLYFMHVRYSSRLVWVFILGSVLWLAIMFTYSFGDYLTRSYLPSPTIWRP